MKTKQLILIAGPAASGKTFLFKKLRKGGCPILRKQLDIENPNEWEFLSVRGMLKSPVPPDKAVLHCDLHNKNYHKHLENMISSAEQVQALTLCVPQTVLLARNHRRILKSIQLLLLNLRTWRYRKKKAKSLYHRQRKNRCHRTLLSIYNDWFDLVDKHGIPSLWINSESIDNPEAQQVVDGDRSAALRTVHPGV